MCQNMTKFYEICDAGDGSKYYYIFDKTKPNDFFNITFLAPFEAVCKLKMGVIRVPWFLMILCSSVLWR